MAARQRAARNAALSPPGAEEEFSPEQRAAWVFGGHEEEDAMELSRVDLEDGDAREGEPRDAALGCQSNTAAGNLAGEHANIALLLLLYTMQGVPMGLAAVLPLILKEQGASFSDLATFSLNSYPFSMKLLWAPIVDSVYSGRVGRRKSWLIPAQLLIGLVMMALSFAMDELLYVEKPHIRVLTVLFFVLYFLCATQDIAVDGWALTMLRKENVGYAATCNSVGQTLGYTLGFTGFMVLQQFKIISLPSFMFLWGALFVVVTAFVGLGKAELPVPSEDEPEDVRTAYKMMLSMTQLRSVRSLCIVLFTWKAGFSIVDSVAPLKLQEYGIPKEHMAYMTSLVMPLYIVLPVVVAKWTTGASPLDLALRAYPWRVSLIPAAAILAYGSPASVNPIPWVFYAVMMLVSVLGAVASQCMFVSQMAFFARVSDPSMGGTYMTLLNTLANLGGMWPATATMRLVDATTCVSDGCPMRTDGFYVMAGFCFVGSAAWYTVGVPYARRIQNMKMSDWRVQ